MKFATVALATVLAASLCVSSNATMRANSELVQGISKTWSNAVASVQSAVTSDKPSKAILLVEYDVPPAHQEDFIEIFKDLQSSVEKEEGALVFGLSRALDQNNIFWLYSEFKTMIDYSKHFTGEAFEAFAKDIAKINVEWKLHFLKEETNFIRRN